MITPPMNIITGTKYLSKTSTAFCSEITQMSAQITMIISVTLNSVGCIAPEKGGRSSRLESELQGNAFKHHMQINSSF